MPGNLTMQILRAHLERGTLQAGDDIAVRVDQTLLQDATGTMATLQFEELGLERVAVPLAVQYVDHNMIQLGFKNPDDHRFLQAFDACYGIHYSRPGNGICHSVQVERFARPGDVLLGADSHTTTSGAVGMIAIGAGGLDVAMCMAGQPFEFETPRVVGRGGRSGFAGNQSGSRGAAGDMILFRAALSMLNVLSGRYCIAAFATEQGVPAQHGHQRQAHNPRAVDALRRCLARRSPVHAERHNTSRLV